MTTTENGRDEFYDHDCALCKKRITREDQEKKSGGGGIVSVTHMVSDRLFWYGLSGIMQFTKDLGLKKDDRLCWDCTINHREDYEPAKLVECAHCKEKYQPLWEPRNGETVYRDGYDCNADCYEKDGKIWVSGGYGSYYDCMRLEVLVPVVKPGDQVCDKCITMFLAEGSLVKEGEKPPLVDILDEK